MQFTNTKTAGRSGGFLCLHETAIFQAYLLAKELKVQQVGSFGIRSQGTILLVIWEMGGGNISCLFALPRDTM
jgi:hypothetical protein